MQSETMPAPGRALRHDVVPRPSHIRSTARSGWRYLWLALITGGGLLLRLWLWWRVPIHQPANDEVEYLRVAHDLIAGRGWVFYEHYHWLRAPLYPLFLAGSLVLGGQDLRWAALPNIAISTLTIPLFYLLAHAVVLPVLPTSEDERHAWRAGLLAALVCAILLPFATFASLWMSETLFTALFAGALVALLRWWRRPAPRTAAFVGLLLGLAILTRSAPLAVMPLLMLWMAWIGWRARAIRRHLLGAAICLLMVLMTIAPWTIRNWLAYGHFIPVETGLSYNLWAFNEPREDQDAIFRTLESIPNPGDRSDYATAKGLARLQEDPSIVLRRIRYNWFYLWHIKPIEDRFLQESYLQDVPGDLFVLALLLDDGLYLLIGAGALAGVVLTPRKTPLMLLGGWSLYIVAVMLLTHSEGRYRQFLFPALIPFAAACWSAGWWQQVHRGRRMLAIGLGLLALNPLLSYPYSWTRSNVQRAWFEMQGDRAMERGDYRTAQLSYRQGAHSDPGSADILLKVGLAHDRAGDLAGALKSYGEAAAIKPAYIPASARLGDALRRAGQDEAAQTAFSGFYSDPGKISDWAWEHIHSPAPANLEVGDGLDHGFVHGMYMDETIEEREVRWTSERAALRLAEHANGSLVRVRLAAPRPDGQPVVARLCVSGSCHLIQANTQWRTYEVLALPCEDRRECDTGERPATIEVTFSTPAFSPANTSFAQPQSNPDTADTRHLGLLVDDAVSIPLDGGYDTSGANGR